MDLLDLLKLMFRRWYVTVPVIVVTLGAALALGSSIQPEYKTTAAILLVPPTTSAAAPTPGASPQPGNPWLRVGENAMAQAVQISISAHESRVKVEAAGGEPDYEVGLVNRSSIVTIDVTATSNERALATVTTVTKLINEEVAARQAEYRPRAGEQISTEVLDPGLNVTQSRSNVLRAQIVVLAIGILLAAVAAVSYDAVLRRRAAARHSGRRHTDGYAQPTGQARVERDGFPQPTGQPRADRDRFPQPTGQPRADRDRFPQPTGQPRADRDRFPQPTGQARDEQHRPAPRTAAPDTTPHIGMAAPAEATQRLVGPQPVVPVARPEATREPDGHRRPASADETIMLTAVRPSTDESTR